MNGEDFNLFLAYGYAAVATSIAVWLLTHFTGKSMWCFGWFAMFIPYILSFRKTGSGDLHGQDDGQRMESHRVDVRHQPYYHHRGRKYIRNH